MRQSAAMTSRLTDVIVDCSDPHALAGFWCSALGYVVVDATPDFVEIRPAAVGDAALLAEIRAGAPAPTLGFQRVGEGKQAKNRLHLDLSPIDCTQAEEVARLLALGSRHTDVGQPASASFVVLLDPEDNEFCVLRSLAPGEFEL